MNGTCANGCNDKCTKEVGVICEPPKDGKFRVQWSDDNGCLRYSWESSDTVVSVSGEYKGGVEVTRRVKASAPRPNPVDRFIGELLHFDQVLQQASESGVLDELAADIDPTIIDQACNGVSALSGEATSTPGNNTPAPQPAPDQPHVVLVECPECHNSETIRSNRDKLGYCKRCGGDGHVRALSTSETAREGKVLGPAKAAPAQAPATVYDERELRKYLVSVFGEYGAPVEVLDGLIKRACQSPSAFKPLTHSDCLKLAIMDYANSLGVPANHICHMVWDNSSDQKQANDALNLPRAVTTYVEHIRYIFWPKDSAPTQPQPPVTIGTRIGDVVGMEVSVSGGKYRVNWGDCTSIHYRSQLAWLNGAPISSTDPLGLGSRVMMGAAPAAKPEPLPNAARLYTKERPFLCQNLDAAIEHLDDIVAGNGDKNAIDLAVRVGYANSKGFTAVACELLLEEGISVVHGPVI